MAARSEVEKATIVAVVTLSIFAIKHHTIVLNRPCRTSLLTGQMYIQELLTGHPGRFKEVASMELPTFSTICQDLRKVGLADTLSISVEEQLAMFLSITGHRWSNRNVRERFQHSGETVYRYTLLPYYTNLVILLMF